MTRTTPSFPRVSVALLLVVAALLVGGCAATKMKPTPVIYTSANRLDLAERVPESKRTNNVEIFYATNRKAKGPTDNRKYTNDVDDRLHLGVADVRIGDKNTSWDQIVRASEGQGGNPAFKYIRARELGQLDNADDEAFIEAINKQLNSTRNHEVSIYVHGFRSSMPPEIEILAKLNLFTARGGAMICFGWPSRQSVMLYNGDVERGKKSAHYLADLVELIANRTDAESINILAYSAGAVVAADGMCQLRDRYPDDDPAALSKRLRIGNVVFAASDLDLKAFARDQFKRIQDVGQNTIIYIAENDAALGWASLGYGASRLGRPDVKSLNLSKKQIEEAAKDTSAQIVDVTKVPGPHGSFGGLRGHGYWYVNDWIMTDLLVILRWQSTAEERGLVRKPGTARWVFPKDYPTRVYEAVHRLAEKTTTAPTTTTTRTTTRPADAATAR